MEFQEMVALFLLFLGVPMIVWNLFQLARRAISSKELELIPGMGGLCGAVGLMTIPARGPADYAWIPLIVDPGCWLIPILAVWFLIMVWHVLRRSGKGTPHREGESERETQAS